MSMIAFIYDPDIAAYGLYLLRCSKWDAKETTLHYFGA